MKYTFFPAGLKLLAGADIMLADFRVLFTMLGHTDSDGVICVTQARLCNELNMAQSIVSRAIGHLLRDGILIRKTPLESDFGSEPFPTARQLIGTRFTVSQS